MQYNCHLLWRALPLVFFPLSCVILHTLSSLHPTLSSTSPHPPLYFTPSTPPPHPTLSFTAPNPTLLSTSSHPTLLSTSPHPTLHLTPLFSPLTLLISCSPVGNAADSCVTLCDLLSGASSHILKGHSKPVMSLDWSPNSDHLLVSGR